MYIHVYVDLALVLRVTFHLSSTRCVYVYTTNVCVYLEQTVDLSGHENRPAVVSQRLPLKI